MEIRFLCGNGRKGPRSLQKKCFGEKIICFSNKKCLKPSLGFTHGYKVGTSIRNTWTWSWIWSWRSMRTFQTRTMRLIIFSQPSIFIRGHLHAQLEHGWWHRAIATLGTGFRVFSIAHSLYTGVPYPGFPTLGRGTSPWTFNPGFPTLGRGTSP